MVALTAVITVFGAATRHVAAEDDAARDKRTQAEILEAGRRAFAECANCHPISLEGTHGIGPNLYGLFGRPVAAAEDFAYSDSLRSAGGVWDEDRLNRYIAQPKFVAPDNDMNFSGILSPHVRADLMAWLRTRPEHFETDLRAAMAAADERLGQQLSRSCTTCHSAGKDAAHKVGPNLWGVIGRDVASAPGYKYTTILTSRRGTWTPEALHQYFIEKRGFRPGSHVVFLRLRTLEQRAALIAWLASLEDDTGR